MSLDQGYDQQMKLTAHEQCERKAWLCEMNQLFYYDQILKLNTSCAQETFVAMKSLVQKNTKLFCVKVSEKYTQMIQQLERARKENLVIIQRQMKKEMMKCLAIPNQTIQKMENKQYKQLTCSEVKKLFDGTQLEGSSHYRKIQDMFQRIKTPLINLKEHILKECSREKTSSFFQAVTQNDRLTPDRNIRVENQQEEELHIQNSDQQVQALKREIIQIKQEKRILLNQTSILQEQLGRLRTRNQQRINEQRSNEQRINEQRINEQRINEQRINEQRSNEQRINENRSRANPLVRTSAHLDSLQTQENNENTQRHQEEHKNNDGDGEWYIHCFPRKRRS